MKTRTQLPVPGRICVAAGTLAIAMQASAATGGLRVTVTAEDGRLIAGAEVTVESRKGERRRATTDVDGGALVERLETGFYRVAAARPQYLGVVASTVRVVRGKTVPVAFVLRRDDELIEEVLVVADAIRSDAYGAASSSYMDRERLRTATGSGADVLRALDGLPGLLSTGEFANFTVRGRGPRDNLILVDGFPYDKVVHFDSSLGEREDIAGGGRYSIFAPNLIDGAEFSPGGWSAAYGGRNGSLLKLRVAEGNPSPSASLRFDLAGAEIVYDGPSALVRDTAIIASARRFDFGQLFDAIGEGHIGSPVLTDVIVKTRTRVDADDALEFLLLHTPEDYHRNVAHVLQSENLEDRELVSSAQDSTLFGVTWTRLVGAGGRWENRFYHRATEKSSSEGEAFPDSMPTVLPEDRVPVRERILALGESETEFGWRSDFFTGNRWGPLRAGVRISHLDLDFSVRLAGDWIRYAFDGRDFRPDPGRRYVVLNPEQTDSAFARGKTSYAAFAEQVFELGSWDVRAGARYEHDGFAGAGYFSPRLSANRRLSPAVRLSATAGSFYQSPRFIERAADPSNFGLGSERVDHVSLGANWRLGDRWTVLAEGYARRLDDLVTGGDSVTGMVGNAGEGTSHGVDVVVNRGFARGWSANAVYSYNDVTLDDNDGAGAYPADYNHQHMLSVGARWEISERWQVGARWKYATGRPRDEFVVHSDVLAGLGGPLRYSQEFVTDNTARWDDFHTLNARVDYRRSVGPVDLVAFLDVLNVYGAAETDELEFNPATGAVVGGDGEPIPLIGLRFEKTW